MFLGVLNRVIIPEMQRKIVKSYIAPWKRIQDILGFRIPRHGFRIPGPGFLSFLVELGLWILIVCWIPDSLSCSLDSIANFSGIPDSTSINFLDSRIKISLHGATRTTTGAKRPLECEFAFLQIGLGFELRH